MTETNASIEIIKIKREAAEKALRDYADGLSDGWIKSYLDKLYPFPQKRRIVKYECNFFRISEDKRWIEKATSVNGDFRPYRTINDVEYQLGFFMMADSLIKNPNEPEEA